jgi:CRISPR system Cascade subunit CasD
MSRFLILRLDGPMQAWGGHTFEDYRPSHLFPTRSGLLGLLGACLGLDRQDSRGLEDLSNSLEFAVRADEQDVEDAPSKRVLKLPDFHTVLNARKVDGSVSKHPVVSMREYLFDAVFTVAVGERAEALVRLDALAQAVRRPYYTPFLGRRSCPIARPLFEGWCEAEDGVKALRKVPPTQGVIYGEGEAVANARPMSIRDVPQHGRYRRFGTRFVYVHADEGGN